MTYQLTEPLEVHTPLGRGHAIFRHHGSDDVWWTVAFESGAMVDFTQKQIFLARSYTGRRGISDEEMKRIIGIAP